MNIHSDYDSAYDAAVRLARRVGREVGIEGIREYGRRRYKLHILPAPQFRQGFELNLEVEAVRPDDPLTSREPLD